MKSKKGFTLIEILVVVLIIGILAAIALPQYKKSVLKSGLAQAIITARDLHNDQEDYYLANGKYASSKAELDKEFTCPKNYTCEITNSKIEVYKSNNTHLSIIYRHNNTQHRLAGKFYCWAYSSDSTAVSICKNLSKNSDTATGEFWTYLN